METHSRILWRRIPCTGEPGRLQSTGSQSWTRLSRGAHAHTGCLFVETAIHAAHGLPWPEGLALVLCGTVAFTGATHTCSVLAPVLVKRCFRRAHRRLPASLCEPLCLLTPPPPHPAAAPLHRSPFRSPATSVHTSELSVMF